MRASDAHDSFRHALHARDLNPAHEKGFRARKNRLVKLGRGGAGVGVEGTGVHVRLELRESADEAVEVFVHAPARLDPEDRDLLVLSTVERLVVHPRFFGVGVLDRRACAHVRAEHGRRGAGGHPDDGPMGDVAVHNFFYLWDFSP